MEIIRVLDYIRGIIRSALAGNRVSGHDFFAGFPQPEKKQIKPNNLSLLYYAVEMLIDSKPSDFDSWRYEFLRDATLKSKPIDSSIPKWNLLEVLKLIQADSSNL